MKGIVSMGRYFLWVAVFLFFYSSMFVVFQHGMREYPQRLAGFWGGIASSFQESYESVQNPGAHAGSEEAGKEELKVGGIPLTVALLIWGGVVLSMIGFFWIVAIAFQESLVWGVVTLVIPGGALIFWLTHFREALPPLILQVIGGFIVGFVASYHGIDLHEYFLGSPAPAAPKAPTPLEGMILPLIAMLFR